MKRTIEQTFVSTFLEHLGYSKACTREICKLLDDHIPRRLAVQNAMNAKIIPFPYELSRALSTAKGENITAERARKKQASKNGKVGLSPAKEKILRKLLAGHPPDAIKMSLAMLRYWRVDKEGDSQ